MFFVMLKILYTTSFLWSWLLVFPTSVGMEWNSANQEITSAVQISSEQNTYEKLELKGCNVAKSLFKWNANARDASFSFLEQIFPYPHKAVGVKSTISLHRVPGEKGCSRSSYNQVEKYARCGGKDIVALLPVLDVDGALNDNGSYVKDLRKEVTSQGDLDFAFDGRRAVRFPTKKLKKNWFTSYTISGYILVNNHKERQYIVSWSSGDTPSRKSMGFYVKSSDDGSSLTFGISHTHKEEMCFLAWNFKAMEKTNTWHFFTLSFERCRARFALNGRWLPPFSPRAHVFEPEKHLQPKFVVGARWSGGVNKYSDYFHGQMSGLLLSRQEFLTENEKILRCISKCEENLEIFTYTKNNDQYLENKRGASINIRGRMNRSKFFTLIKTLRYFNLNRIEWNKRRLITLDVSNEHGKSVRKIFEVKTSKRVPNIQIEGECRETHSPIKSDTKGAFVCPNIDLSMSSCYNFIDILTIRSTQKLNKTEHLFVPNEILEKNELNMTILDSGLMIYGVDFYSGYQNIIKQLRYINNASEKTNVSRTFEVIASTYNGLVKSNKFIIEFNTTDIMNEPPIAPQEEEDKIDEKIIEYAFIILSIVAAIFGLFLLIPLLVFFYQRCIRPHRSTQSTFTILDNSLNTQTGDDFDSSVYYFDWREPPHIKIDPSERVSISNDPLTDLLAKESSIPECSVTDGSIYSDYDGDESDFENDSIRQLEWESLEKNLKNFPGD